MSLILVEELIILSYMIIHNVILHILIELLSLLRLYQINEKQRVETKENKNEYCNTVFDLDWE